MWNGGKFNNFLYFPTIFNSYFVILQLKYW